MYDLLNASYCANTSKILHAAKDFVQKFLMNYSVVNL